MINIENVPAATAWLRQEIGTGPLAFVVRDSSRGPLRRLSESVVGDPMTVPLTAAELHARIAARYEFCKTTKDGEEVAVDFPRMAVSHIINDPDSAPNVQAPSERRPGG